MVKICIFGKYYVYIRNKKRFFIISARFVGREVVGIEFGYRGSDMKTGCAVKCARYRRLIVGRAYGGGAQILKHKRKRDNRKIVPSLA